MNTSTQTRTKTLLKIMLVLAWIAFIGFMIEAGTILTSYIISCINPEATKKLYNGMELYNLSQFNPIFYMMAVLFLVVAPVLKSMIALQVIKILSAFNLEHPFTMEVTRRLQRITLFMFWTWVTLFLSNTFRSGVMKIEVSEDKKGNAAELLLLVGLLFVISQVFRRGVEIQSENDLTV